MGEDIGSTLKDDAPQSTSREDASWASRLKSSVLMAAGIAGALAGLWFFLSVFAGWGLVVVATGSMAPALPAGAVAVTVPVGAAQLEVGDIVTVPRQGTPPTITHRVVAIHRVGVDSEARDLVLRGDANSLGDPHPYRVTEAARTAVIVPHLGALLWQLRSPGALAIGTFLVAGLVIWAFWPGGHRPEDAGPS